MSHFPTRDPSASDRAPWRAQVLTIFPEMFPGPLGISLTGQALAAGIWSLEAIDIRDFGLGRHRQVDDTPAGGGAGMVMRADVLGPAIDHARAKASAVPPAIYLSPRGKPLTQARVRDLASGPGVLLLAGRFEGVDERIIAGRNIEEISLGDYVLSGGELGAMVLLDACVRLLPGVLGASASLSEESFENGRTSTGEALGTESVRTESVFCGEVAHSPKAISRAIIGSASRVLPASPGG